MFEAAAPALREAKPAWSDVPADAAQALEAWLGARITDARIAWGGYGPGASFIIDLADGSRRFLKAQHPGQTPEGAKMLAREVEVHGRYPFIAAVAPALLGRVAAGDWQWLVFEHIDAAIPALPWTEAKLEALFTALGSVFEKSRHLPADGADHVADVLPARSEGWHAIAEDPEMRTAFLSAFVDREAAGDWLNHCLPILRPLQHAVQTIGGPVGLMHFDLRSDNLLFRPDGSAVLLDWSDGCVAPLALELAGFGPSCIAEGGASSDKLRAMFEAAIGMAIPERDMAVALANFAGFFALRIGAPWRADMPRLRWGRRQRLWGAMQWAETLLGLPALPRMRMDDLTAA
jgi:hypothetical protein